MALERLILKVEETKAWAGVGWRETSSQRGRERHLPLGAREKAKRAVL